MRFDEYDNDDDDGRFNAPQYAFGNIVSESFQVDDTVVCVCVYMRTDVMRTKVAICVWKCCV